MVFVRYHPVKIIGRNGQLEGAQALFRLTPSRAVLIIIADALCMTARAVVAPSGRDIACHGLGKIHARAHRFGMILHEPTDGRLTLVNGARFEVLSRRDNAVSYRPNRVPSNPSGDAEFDVLLVRHLVGFLGSLFFSNRLGKRAFALK